MKTLIKLPKITQRILAATALFLVSLANNSASAQTRSYTLEALQKTDYIIDEACDIVDYFYFNDGELISKSMYFQDYAYYLYNAHNYRLSLQYSLMARSYAVNAIEICDDYWQYYDYYYYGYSPTWGRNINVTIRTGNVQLHWGLTNARYHSNLRVNWDLYFTAKELRYYRSLPSEVILLDGFYKYKGRIVYFNDRHINHNIYSSMRINIHNGRNNYSKSHHNKTTHMPPKPKDMKPHNAPAPTTHTRRETTYGTGNSHNTTNNNTSNRNAVNNQGSTNTNTDSYRRTANDNKSAGNSVTNTNSNSSQPSSARRSSSSQTTGSSVQVESKSTPTQATRRQATPTTDTGSQPSSSSSSSASSGSSSRRR
ncbi:MAG: hypothetical protein LBH30_05870 [Prevotellaceae bacterium]|nr:hypothetical protein [Prevotellaceae bacterium]